MPTRRPRPLIAACVLWVACAVYTWPFVTRGWIPHDEGTIAQSAERILHGEMPHRDFDEVYTGGLSYLHAGAFRVFGTSLETPRLVLFGFFLVFVAAAIAIAWQIAPGWGAVLMGALVVAWSAPNYFASLPSWYTLFFATFGSFALLRFLDTDRRRWLVAAGVCGGLSILMKVTGVYYVAAAALFLAYIEQSTRLASDRVANVRRSSFWLVTAIPSGLSLAFLLRALWQTSAPFDVVQLFLPPLALGALVAWREWRHGRDGFGSHLIALGRLISPFLAGLALPVAAFALWFASHGALLDLLRGVFVLPQRRLSEAALPPPAAGAIGLAAPYILLLLLGRQGIRRAHAVAAGLFVFLGIAVYLARDPVVYRAIWAVARCTPLVAVVTLIWTDVSKASDGIGFTPDLARHRAWLFVVATAFMALVQLPYATPTYFCYVAPMAVLAIGSLVSMEPRAPRAMHAAVALFFLAFAIVFVNRSYGWNLGVAFIPYTPDSRLAIDRGGLRVPAEDKQTYEELVRVLRVHAVGGTIIAGPDCPEVYFLSGFPNPTRAIFDFLSPVQEDEAWLAGLLSRAPIRAAVINLDPLFSKPLDQGMLRLLELRFPSSQQIGRFLVRFE